jgi:anti-sigma factor RsiW
MACEQYLNSIHEAVDGTIGPIRRAELELHLDQCEACRALRDDLQRIHDAAAALPTLDAPDGAWLQIAGRLRQEGRISAAPAARPRRHYAGWLAAAAAVILAAGSAVLLLTQRSAPSGTTPAPVSSPTATAPGNAANGKSVEAVTSEVETAQQQFEKAIADLEKVVKTNQQALDPGTSQTIDKNLGIIDQAIAENRVAVKTEPANVAARETLFEALRQKVSLLQDTITLINEMRKGNNAAAAQLVNKS